MSPRVIKLLLGMKKRTGTNNLLRTGKFVLSQLMVINPRDSLDPAGVEMPVVLDKPMPP
jgi:hypothetical protein